MKEIIPHLLVTCLYLMPIKSIGADSFEQIWALYSVGSYEKAYEGIQNMTGPLSQSSLWLLGEMHFLGRGARVDMSLARKFLEQSSLKRFSSKYIYPFRKQRPVYSLGGTVWAESRQLRNVSRYSATASWYSINASRCSIDASW